MGDLISSVRTEICDVPVIPFTDEKNAEAERTLQEKIRRIIITGNYLSAQSEYAARYSFITI